MTGQPPEGGVQHERAGREDDEAAIREVGRGSDPGQRPDDHGPDHGRGKERRKLVEGAVTDAPVVLVVEAVELNDQDPGRPEGYGPQDGLGWKAGDQPG